MISLNYAKKIGNKYVLNLYADKQSDLENFDISKNFMFYGTPAVGSVVTVVGGDKIANYYLNKEGVFVEIKTGGDEPVPVELTPFSDGQRINGFVIDPNAVPEGYSTMADYMATFDKNTGLLQLKGAGAVWVDLSKDLIQVFPIDDTYMAVYVFSEEKAQSIDESLHAGWILMDSTGDTPVYSQITEVTYLIPDGFSHTIDTKEDTVYDTAGWNGVFVGAHLDPVQ